MRWFTPHPQAGPTPPARPVIETMEERQLLAATFGEAAALRPETPIFVQSGGRRALSVADVTGVYTGTLRITRGQGIGSVQQVQLNVFRDRASPTRRLAGTLDGNELGTLIFTGRVSGNRRVLLDFDNLNGPIRGGVVARLGVGGEVLTGRFTETDRRQTIVGRLRLNRAELVDGAFGDFGTDNQFGLQPLGPNFVPNTGTFGTRVISNSVFGGVNVGVLDPFGTSVLGTSTFNSGFNAGGAVGFPSSVVGPIPSSIVGPLPANLVGPISSSFI